LISDVRFLTGGGEMGALMRAHDWRRSSLGPPSQWPQSLRTIVRLMLNTGHPMFVFAGADGACLYNDAYRESIGPERHPGALGRPAKEVWAEIWHIIGPQIEQVMAGGGATWHVNALVPITRHGRLEDVYWTYSYSPIDDESAPGGIGGVLVVCTETTKHVLAERELSESMDRFRELAAQLGDANRLKDEFLATLAHELRNPLAPIKTALDLLKMAPDDREVSTAAREVMERQLVQVVRLIDDLLDLSRVSRGLIELRRVRVPLARLLEDAVETSRPVIELAGHVLVATAPDPEIELEADPTRLIQVFTNLLNNAAKFTPRGGRIELSCSQDGRDIVVSVRDNGIGISPMMLERVFEMFAQVGRSHAQTSGGLGIGLTLVRRLVEMHGGQVAARSGGPNAGSEFLVRLPIALEHRAEPSAPPAIAAPAALSRRRRILIADDNADAAESLVLMLGMAGHETRMARDGDEALAIAREFQPDTLVLDIAMPGLSGHELARRIRAEAWGRTVLLIAASGWGQAADKERSKAAGFDHHLVKPVAFDALEKLLRESAR
jgi:signal transduction histidine kinase/CheY-like chemotaxis protein